ncbi:MAG: hypothetical protein Q9214_005583, partial [Letrouitia sp. 1 TL-2023]
RLQKSKPGQHIYLALATRVSSPQDKFRINPFTIASKPFSSSSHPHEGGKLNLIIRSLSGTTARLARFHEETNLMIEGPYGAAATSFPDFLTAGFASVLLVAGGVGATFTAPIYADLVSRIAGSRPLAQDHDKVKVRHVWAVRSLADTSWAAAESVRGCEIYVTAGSGSGGRRVASRNRSREQQQPEEEQEQEQEPFVVKAPDEEEGEEAIELQERARLLSESEAADGHGGGGGGGGEATTVADTAPQHVLRSGRPDFRTIVAEVFAGSGGGNKKAAVLVCGPKAMSKSLRREVAVWVRKGREETHREKKIKKGARLCICAIPHPSGLFLCYYTSKASKTLLQQKKRTLAKPTSQAPQSQPARAFKGRRKKKTEHLSSHEPSSAPQGSLTLTSANSLLLMCTQQK